MMNYSRRKVGRKIIYHCVLYTLQQNFLAIVCYFSIFLASIIYSVFHRVFTGQIFASSVFNYLTIPFWQVYIPSSTYFLFQHTSLYQFLPSLFVPFLSFVYNQHAYIKFVSDILFFFPLLILVQPSYAAQELHFIRLHFFLHHSCSSSKFLL